MRPFYLLFTLMPALLLIRCAAVPMPVTVIPERGNSVEATMYAGNNGFGINTLYATKSRTVFNLALQASPILTKSRAYEFGIGQVIADSLSNSKVMFMLTYGAGKYVASPLILGATGQVWEVDSRAKRLSFYSNLSLSRKNGIIGRVSGYWGRSSQQRVHADDIEDHPFSALGIELLFYRVPGKRKHFVMGVGMSLTANKSDYKGKNVEKDLSPSPAYLFIGYRLAKKPKPSPLPLSQ